MDDEKKKEVLMLEKRLSVLKRECSMLKSEDQQLWKSLITVKSNLIKISFLG